MLQVEEDEDEADLPVLKPARDFPPTARPAGVGASPLSRAASWFRGTLVRCRGPRDGPAHSHIEPWLGRAELPVVLTQVGSRRPKDDITPVTGHGRDTTERADARPAPPPGHHAAQGSPATTPPPAPRHGTCRGRCSTRRTPTRVPGNPSPRVRVTSPAAAAGEPAPHRGGRGRPSRTCVIG